MGKVMTILIMVIAAGGMIHGLKKQKEGKRWGQPLAIACAVVALIFALRHSVTQRGPSMRNIIDREMGYQMVSAKKLGLYLAEKYPGSRAVIIVQPTRDTAEARPNALVEGLRDGLGTKIEILGEISPEVPDSAKKAFSMEMPLAGDEEGGVPEETEMVPPLEYWFTAELFDQLAQQYHKRCDLIITTIGLPQDLAQMAFWTMKPRPKLAIASGSIYELRNAIKGNAVVAAVTYSPTAVYEDKPPPADLDEAFDKRFLLVTPDNVDEISQRYADLFTKD